MDNELTPQDESWSQVYKLFKVRLVSGERTWGLMMRRRTLDGWEYRSMTDNEDKGYREHDAW